MLILPFVILGFAYGMIAPAMWSCIYYEIDQKFVGTVQYHNLFSNLNYKKKIIFFYFFTKGFRTFI